MLRGWCVDEGFSLLMQGGFTGRGAVCESRYFVDFIMIWIHWLTMRRNVLMWLSLAKYLL